MLYYDPKIFKKNESKSTKMISPIPLEFRFETPKFEFSDVENPQIDIFAPKIKFFFDQNLDFVLGFIRGILVSRNRTDETIGKLAQRTSM